MLTSLQLQGHRSNIRRVVLQREKGDFPNFTKKKRECRGKEKKGETICIPLEKGKSVFFHEGKEKLPNFEREKGDVDSLLPPAISLDKVEEV